jgi:hypothetical protein
MLVKGLAWLSGVPTKLALFKPFPIPVRVGVSRDNLCAKHMNISATGQRNY